MGHRLYRVVETKDLSEEELQKILNEATNGLPEMQIDHVVGTKIILGFESGLNANGRLAMKSSTDSPYNSINMLGLKSNTMKNNRI